MRGKAPSPCIRKQLCIKMVPWQRWDQIQHEALFQESEEELQKTHFMAPDAGISWLVSLDRTHSEASGHYANNTIRDNIKRVDYLYIWHLSHKAWLFHDKYISSSFLLWFTYNVQKLNQWECNWRTLTFRSSSVFASPDSGRQRHGQDGMKGLI